MYFDPATPEKRLYDVQRMATTEAGIDRGFTRDLYVALGERQGDGWALRTYVKPFSNWIGPARCHGRWAASSASPTAATASAPRPAARPRRPRRMIPVAVGPPDLRPQISSGVNSPRAERPSRPPPSSPSPCSRPPPTPSSPTKSSPTPPWRRAPARSPAELRCVVCQSESIDDSNADIARDLRLLVRERIVAGDTDTQVQAFVVDRYGEFVLFRPPFTARNAALWLAGPVLLLAGGGIAFAFIRRRAAAPPPPRPPLTPEEEARLSRADRAGLTGPARLAARAAAMVGARTGEARHDVPTRSATPSTPPSRPSPSTAPTSATASNRALRRELRDAVLRAAGRGPRPRPHRRRHRLLLGPGPLREHRPPTVERRPPRRVRAPPHRASTTARSRPSPPSTAPPPAPAPTSRSPATWSSPPSSAVFLQAFARIGLIPDAGGTYWLPRQVGFARAMGAALFAEPVTARDAAAWGMIWQAVPDADFAATVAARARQLAQGPTASYRLIKQALRASLGNGLPDQLALEARLQAEAAATADFREGVAAFLAKRPARYEGR